MLDIKQRIFSLYFLWRFRRVYPDLDITIDEIEHDGKNEYYISVGKDDGDMSVPRYFHFNFIYLIYLDVGSVKNIVHLIGDTYLDKLEVNEIPESKYFNWSFVKSKMNVEVKKKSDLDDIDRQAVYLDKNTYVGILYYNRVGMLGSQKFVLNKNYVKWLGFSEERFLEDCFSYFKKKCGLKIIRESPKPFASMSSIIDEAKVSRLEKLCNDGLELYRVSTNKYIFNSSATIFYRGFLSDLFKLLGEKPFYVIPLSFGGPTVLVCEDEKVFSSFLDIYLGEEKIAERLISGYIYYYDGETIKLINIKKRR